MMPPMSENHVLRQTLESPVEDERRDAVAYLFQHYTVVPREFMDMLIADPSEIVRAEFLECYAKSGLPLDASYFKVGIKDNSTGVRVAAVRGLACFKTIPSELLDRAIRDRRPEVRSEAYGVIEDRINSKKESKATEGFGFVRHNLKQGSTEQKQAMLLLLCTSRTVIWEDLLAACHDPDVQGDALYALSCRKQIPYSVQIHIATQEPTEVKLVLARSNMPMRNDVVSALMGDSSVDVRLAALHHLHTLHPLVKASTDPSPKVRAAAYRQMQIHRDRVALSILDRGFRDPNPEVRQAAAELFTSFYEQVNIERGHGQDGKSGNFFR